MTFYILIQFLFTYLDAAREFCALCEIATVAICGLSGEASGIGFKSKVNRELKETLNVGFKIDRDSRKISRGSTF